MTSSSASPVGRRARKIVGQVVAAHGSRTRPSLRSSGQPEEDCRKVTRRIGHVIYTDSWSARPWLPVEGPPAVLSEYGMLDMPSREKPPPGPIWRQLPTVLHCGKEPFAIRRSDRSQTHCRIAWQQQTCPSRLRGVSWSSASPSAIANGRVNVSRFSGTPANIAVRRETNSGVQRPSTGYGVITYHARGFSIPRAIRSFITDWAMAEPGRRSRPSACRSCPPEISPPRSTARS